MPNRLITATHYRPKAVQCEQLAKAIPYNNLQAGFAEMADLYLQLAMQSCSCTLLTAKPRPVGWAERRARIDEVGAVWPVADDIRLEAVDLAAPATRAPVWGQ